jgi:hypothetical protein
MKKNKIKDSLLTKDQVEIVKMCIVSSMKEVYTDKGEVPGEGFYKAAKAVETSKQNVLSSPSNTIV